MKPTRKERQGTIHDLESQIVNLEQIEEHHPHTKKQIAKYKKLFNEYGLFPKGANNKKKNEIISKLKIVNIDENKIIDNQKILKALESYNRLVDKETRRLKLESMSGKNMIKNEKILQRKEKIELNIPDRIRSDLKIFDKEVLLRKYYVKPFENKVKYYSGQDYNFVITNGFGKALIISDSKLKKLRKEKNIVEFLVNEFKKDVEASYEKDKQKYSKKERNTWKKKKYVYDKILNEVMEHNLKIARGEQYNKPFIKKDKKGNILKKDSEIPIFMKIFGENIKLFIP